ncbi:unnamed protein product [Heligmosomoides polygyrus]|uniref:DNA-directed RNA polymerase n=1 Tax=Heligmosomoides polygyrus TaxID=6339 RepID=A0A3P7YW49_HELPZ|nr:unnamed protein product [Heligmosomoides polygyrus]
MGSSAPSIPFWFWEPFPLEAMGKNQFRESDLARKVVGVKFSAGSSEFIRQTSHIRVLSSRLYEEGEAKWNPAKHGPLDRRLGTSEVLRLCSTCGCNLSECVGHFGYIDLGFPVFHVGYFKLTIHVLQCICKPRLHIHFLSSTVKSRFQNCSGLLLDEKQRSYYLRQIANPNLSYLHRKHLHSSMVKASKKNSLCPACGHQNGENSGLHHLPKWYSGTCFPTREGKVAREAAVNRTWSGPFWSVGAEQNSDI